jgi:hypothetical protein
MSFWGTLMMSLQAGYQAARRVFEDPSTAYQQANYQQQQGVFNLLWAYYDNAIFDKFCRYVNSQQYKANYNLYRNIESLYNPVNSLVEFYAAKMYPGILPIDDTPLPDGISLAIPFSKTTAPELQSAVAQFWQWSNWQANKSLEPRYGAALGSVLVEVVDDLERGKVCADMCWPGNVCDLELDRAGNVKEYVVEYLTSDDDGTYLYRKEVDQESFTYFRDGKPYDYGDGQEVGNPYGFTPAVWIKHKDMGSLYGAPAMAGMQPKIDKLNELVSHTYDQIHRIIGAPIGIFASGPIQNLFSTQKRGPTADFVEPSADQESVLMLKGPADGHVESLAGNLDLAAVDLHIGRLLTEIEKRHPEIVFYEQLRAMSQVTGPAAERLMGDVSGRIIDTQAIYDQANIKLFQMAVAIGGYRANSGGWGQQLSPQQQKFMSFNLDSYQKGDLNMVILPRPLLTPTKTEKAQEKQMFWTGVNLAVQAGVPLEVVLRDEGWPEERIAQLGQAKVDQIQRNQMLASEDVIPATSQ